MNNRTEGILAIVAAFIVMLSAMWQPLVSAAVAAGALFVVGVYRLTRTRLGG
jgi:hypothetical protein